jgi:hypothetical protein
MKPYVVVHVFPDERKNQYQTSLALFDLASEVSLFLWGKYLPQYAIFKNGQRFDIAISNFDEFQAQLEKFGENYEDATN